MQLAGARLCLCEREDGKDEGREEDRADRPVCLPAIVVRGFSPGAWEFEHVITLPSAELWEPVTPKDRCTDQSGSSSSWLPPLAPGVVRNNNFFLFFYFTLCCCCPLLHRWVQDKGVAEGQVPQRGGGRRWRPGEHSESLVPCCDLCCQKLSVYIYLYIWTIS